MSDTNRIKLAFVKESVYGEQVAGAKLQTLRLTGESLKQDSSIIPSEEIRDDRQIANIVRTTIGASGGVNFEMSHLTYDDLLAAALQSTNVRALVTLTMDTKPTTTTDTITIGGVTYRFMTTMAAINDIAIGADLAASQANLIATINGTGVAGTNYYAGTTSPHPSVRIGVFVSDDAILTAIKAGLDGNAIVSTETFTAATNVFSAATLLGGLGWTATVTKTAITISAAAADDSFNDSGSGLAAFVANQWIYVSGFATAANNGWFKINAVTAGKITVKNGTGIVNEAATPSVTIKQCPSITNGTTLDTFNLEKTYADLSNILNLYTGMAVGNLNLNVPVDGIITGSFEFIGTREQSLASSGGSGYDAATTSIPLATVNDFDNLFEGDANLSIINFTLALVNGLRARLEAGTLGPSSIGVGSIAITGTLQVYFTTHMLMDKYLNHNQSSLAIALKDGSGNGYVIDLPAIRFTSGQRVAGGRNDDVIANMEWSAFMHGTEAKTIRIARLDA